jgi:hypothetical protein
MSEASTSGRDYDVELIEAVRAFLGSPAEDRARHTVGKGKLHRVYRIEHGGARYVVKVKGRETLQVRLVNWWKGLRHYAVTGETNRLERARVDDRWKNELMTAVGWKALGFETLHFLPYPDPDVRLMRDAELPTLAEHLRDPGTERRFKLFSLKEVAGIMFARHTLVSAASDPTLFHEEPHTGNLLYQPGRLIYFDQEFLPDPTKPDIHHAAVELIALAQSALRDLGYEAPAEVIAAIARGYPDPQILETAARILDVRRPRWAWLAPRRSPVSAEELAGFFREHAVPEVRQRPAERAVPLGMPGDLGSRPESNPLG